MAPIITSTYILMTTIIGIRLIEPGIRSINGHHHDNFVCHPIDNSTWKWQGRGKKIRFKVQHKFLQLLILLAKVCHNAFFC
jgi:hypothetical protein